MKPVYYGLKIVFPLQTHGKANGYIVNILEKNSENSNWLLESSTMTPKKIKVGVYAFLICLSLTVNSSVLILDINCFSFSYYVHIDVHELDNIQVANWNFLIYHCYVILKVLKHLKMRGSTLYPASLNPSVTRASHWWYSSLWNTSKTLTVEVDIWRSLTANWIRRICTARAPMKSCLGLTFADLALKR